MANDEATGGLRVGAAWEKAVVPAEGGTATLLVRITPDPIERPGQRRAPVDVAFVLDRSGSMAGGKLDLVKQATTTAIGLLRDEDRAALVVYDQQVDVLHPLQPATARAKAAMRLALHGVDEGGSTNLSGGWLTGCDELAAGMSRDGDDRFRLRRCLLLTDGQANVGIVDPAQLMHHASELRKRGITTTCLGVGQDFDEVLLSGMAEAGGGNFQYIERADQLPAFFARELGELLTVAAARTTVSLTMPHGVRATLLNAFPHERHGKTIEVALGDLPAGDEICLVFDLTVAPGHAGTSHRVVVSAAWVDPAADATRETEVVPPLLGRVPGPMARHAPANPAVAEEVALQRAAAMQREAMRLDREGRHAESRARLREHQVMLAAAPRSMRVMDSMAAMDSLAQADPSAPLSEGMRKRVTFDSMRRSRGKSDDRTPTR